MRIFTSFLRKLANRMGLQFMRLRTYTRIMAYQNTMQRLGVRYIDLEAFDQFDLYNDPLHETVLVAKMIAHEENYFSKLLNRLSQGDNAVIKIETVSRPPAPQMPGEKPASADDSKMRAEIRRLSAALENERIARLIAQEELDALKTRNAA